MSVNRFSHFHGRSLFFFLDHLACAALLAISRRCSGFSFLLLAWPPRRPRWTAWGSLDCFFTISVT